MSFHKLASAGTRMHITARPRCNWMSIKKAFTGRDYESVIYIVHLTYRTLETSLALGT